MKRLLCALPTLVLAAFAYAAKASVIHDVVVLNGEKTSSELGPVAVHVIKFWGEDEDSNDIIVSGAITQRLIAMILDVSPPKTRTRVLTLDDFTAEYVKKDKDPFVVSVRQELRTRMAVMVSHKRESPRP